MKLAELLPLITEQTMVELSYLSGSETRVACCCDDVHSVIDCVRKVYVALMDCLTLILMAIGLFLAAYAVYLLVLWF